MWMLKSLRSAFGPPRSVLSHYNWHYPVFVVAEVRTFVGTDAESRQGCSVGVQGVLHSQCVQNAFVVFQQVGNWSSILLHCCLVSEAGLCSSGACTLLPFKLRHLTGQHLEVICQTQRVFDQLWVGSLVLFLQKLDMLGLDNIIPKFTPYTSYCPTSIIYKITTTNDKIMISGSNWSQ